jgi:hypothetical protein
MQVSTAGNMNFEKNKPNYLLWEISEKLYSEEIAVSRNETLKN